MIKFQPIEPYDYNKFMCIYNSLQLLISSTGGCELLTKCIAIVSNNDNGNIFISFIALSISYGKFTMCPLSVVLLLLVYFNLINMVQQW
jgi:hypothetical protein